MSIPTGLIIDVIGQFAEDTLGSDAAPWLQTLEDFVELGLERAIDEWYTREIEAPGIDFV